MIVDRNHAASHRHCRRRPRRRAAVQLAIGNPKSEIRNAGDGQGGNGLEEVVHYCQDANYNTTALIAEDTGVAVERYCYAPYGPPTFYGGDWSERSESEFACETLYCSYRYDPETGLYHVRFRYLHPETRGRYPGYCLNAARDAVG